MKKYNLQATHSYKKEELLVSNTLLERMWQLFIQIGIFWKNGESSKDAKSQLLVFMTNRIALDPAYLKEYENAVLVIDELIEDLGEEKGYETLFTTFVDEKKNPETYLERAKVKVSNEFVLLQLAVGGFKAFGAKNYPGYFGGANVEGNPPYRTYEE